MKRILPAFLAIFLSCSWRTPDLPPSDILLEGTYSFRHADNSTVRAMLEGSWLTFTAHGAVALTNPGFNTPDYGLVDIVEEGAYSILEMAPDSGFLMLDITRQWPPAQAVSYVFHGGLNRLGFTRIDAADEEQLLIRVKPDGITRSWATFAKRTPPTVAGDYTFVGATSQEMEELLRGATVSFAVTDSSFLLSNPVTVDMDSIVHIFERGTYSVSMDSLRLAVASQEPAGAESLFVLTPPATTAGVAFSDGRLALSFQAPGRVETTYWAPPETVGEVEPNDTFETATSVGSTGSYSITGTIDRGGVGLEGYTGDLDYFRIDAGADGQFSADLSWQDAADLDLFLFDAEGIELARATEVGQSPPEALARAVREGQTLYLMIVSVDNPASYVCSVQVP